MPFTDPRQTLEVCADVTLSLHLLLLILARSDYQDPLHSKPALELEHALTSVRTNESRFSCYHLRGTAIHEFMLIFPLTRLGPYAYAHEILLFRVNGTPHR